MEKENRSVTWQHKGGALEIPDGWAVYRVDLDADEPYLLISEAGEIDQERRLLIPKALAYYLTTHFCGSESMSKKIKAEGQWVIQTKIKNALGITS